MRAFMHAYVWARARAYVYGLIFLVINCFYLINLIVLIINQYPSPPGSVVLCERQRSGLVRARLGRLSVSSSLPDFTYFIFD